MQGRGLHVPPHKREQEITEAVQLYDKKYSIREIALKLDRSYTAVHGYLKEAKVVMRPRGGRRNTERSATTTH